MRVLVVATAFPYPPEDGNRLRTWNLLKEMSRRHCLSLAAFAEPFIPEEAIDAVQEFVQDLLLLPRPTRAVRLWNTALSLGSGRPYSLRIYWSRALESRLREWDRAGSFDLVHFHHPHTGQHAAALLKTPAVLDTHNVHSMIWGRMAETVSNPLLRRFCRHQRQLMRLHEPQVWELAQAVVAVSEEDAERIRTRLPRARVHVVPNGVDCEHFQPVGTAGTAPAVAFTGSMSYQANVDGVLHFVNSVWPRVQQELPQAMLYLVGGHPPRAVQRLAGPKVVVTGRVPDTRPYLARAGVAIVPLRVGGGTRLKILEALAMGKPVVSTTVGAEGIPIKEAGGIVTADTAEAFAEAVCDLLRDEARGRRMGELGRGYAVQHYDWALVAQQMEAAYQDAVKSLCAEIDRNGSGLSPRATT